MYFLIENDSNDVIETYDNHRDLIDFMEEDAENNWNDFSVRDTEGRLCEFTVDPMNGDIVIIKTEGE